MSRCNERRVRDHVIYVICQSGNFGELDCAKINEVRITPPGYRPLPRGLAGCLWSFQASGPPVLVSHDSETKGTKFHLNPSWCDGHKHTTRQAGRDDAAGLRVGQAVDGP